MFRWTRKGRVFAPSGERQWLQSHAQNPCVLQTDDRLRIFFNSRSTKDARGAVCAYASFVDVAANDPGKVLAIADRPILELGELGTFDQFGVMASAIVRMEREVWLYYVGWTRSEGVPYHHAIGLAISRDGGTSFGRYAKGPVLTRTDREPFIQNSPYVARFGDKLHMWYSTGTQWIAGAETPESIYVVVHATSDDGIAWQRDGVPCLPAKLEYECQTSPSVLKLGDRYHMWFSYRCGLDFRNADRGYRIGYAWSEDLVRWNREDETGELLPSEQGWDSQMVCYPCVTEVNGKLLMFYSGNYFGRDGFGYAEVS